MAGYRFKDLEDLKKQLLLSPPDVRRKYADRLEELLRSFDTAGKYAYQFIYLAITGFRPDEDNAAIYKGEELLGDLLRMLSDLSESSPTEAAEAGETVYTLDQVERQYNVSERTVFRWRQKGLVSRKYLFPDGRQRTGVRHSVLMKFIEENQDSVARSVRFSKTSEEEHEEIIARARAYSERHGLTLTAAAERIARELERARETVRSALKAHEKEHPESPIFPHARENFEDEQKSRIYQQWQNGVSIDSLCEQFGRSRASIYRIINQARAMKILEEQIDYVFSAEFLEDDADEKMLGDAGENRRNLSAGKAVAPLSISGTPLLDKEEEQALFRRYNYIKHKICGLRAELNPKRYVPAKLLARIEQLKKMAVETKNEILEANLRLVVSVARKHAGQLISVSDLISEGTLCLMKAVETFDFTRGTRFSTYATWALMRHFARTVPEKNYELGRFVSVDEETLDSLRSAAPNTADGAGLLEELRSKLDRAVRLLSEREQTVIRLRFGLDADSESQTLAQVGEKLGVSRERVRQIEAEALKKMKDFIKR